MDLVEVNVQPSSGKPLMDVKSDDASGASMESEGLVKKLARCTPIACSRAVGNPAQLLLGEGP